MSYSLIESVFMLVLVLTINLGGLKMLNKIIRKRKFIIPSILFITSLILFDGLSIALIYKLFFS